MHSLAVERGLGAVSAREFHRNLALLGFFASAEAAWVRSLPNGDAVLDSEVFDRVASHENALLAIVHFLLLRVSPTARRELSGCFPVHDNNQRRELKAKARKLLEALEASDVVPVGTARGSTLNMAKGKSAQILVWVLSHAAMRRETKRLAKGLLDHGQLPGPEPPLASLARDVLATQPADCNPGLGAREAEQGQKPTPWAAICERTRGEKEREEAKLRDACAKVKAENSAVEQYLRELEDEERALEARLAEFDLDPELDRRASDVDASAPGQANDDKHRAAALQRRSLLLSLAESPSLEALEQDLDGMLSGRNGGVVSIEKPAAQVVKTNVTDRCLELDRAVAATKRSVLKPAIDHVQLEQCLLRIERLRRDVASLSRKLGKDAEHIDRVRAQHASTLLGMR